MNKVGIIFPHQLFEQNELLDHVDTVYIVEEYLFFRHYRFHRQKIALHRASMKFYADYLAAKNIKVVYIDAQNELSDIRILIAHLNTLGIDQLHYIDVTDNWLEMRIQKACDDHNIVPFSYNSPLFLNTPEQLTTYFAGKKKFFQTDFYKQQRKHLDILMDEQGKPVGDKWTYDEENRLKYPKGKVPPIIAPLSVNKYYKEAFDYTTKNFGHHYGVLNEDFIYPSTFEESKAWFQDFLESRFNEFGAYEDAIVAKEVILHHSLITPMLNVGLLTPKYVIDQTLVYASKHDIGINSVEGFVRQIIGWREFIRGVYQVKGTEERTRNYWGFSRKIPSSFWNGTTGIEPLDIVIRKVLDTGYCHHIERLMVVGNFMLLCDFDPDEVYRWYMELFVDSYDWVMVPNVYGMSQFADGGLMSTKPYISGSNYLMKMSDYKKGDWQAIWDGLFWRFMHTHRKFFLQNPRLGMLIRSFDKMPE